jgi:flagellar FliL protein
MADPDSPAQQPGTAPEEAPKEASASSEPPQQSNSKRNKIIVIGGVIFLLTAVAGYWFALGPGSKKSKDTKEVVAEKVDLEKLPKVFFFDLPDLFVNLNGPDRRLTFLKLSIAIEVAEDSHLKRLEQVKPRLLDHIQIYMRQLRIEDLKGSMGMQRLREELILRINAAAAPVKVKDVLFKEMLVQ